VEELLLYSFRNMKAVAFVVARGFEPNSPLTPTPRCAVLANVTTQLVLPEGLRRVLTGCADHSLTLIEATKARDFRWTSPPTESDLRRALAELDQMPRLLSPQ